MKNVGTRIKRKKRKEKCGRAGKESGNNYEVKYKKIKIDEMQRKARRNEGKENKYNLHF